MNLESFCRENIQLSIYGCGVHGKLLYELLKIKRIKVESYIISDSEDVSKWEREELPVLKLSEWQEMYLNAKHGILIAVSNIYLSGVLENLQKNGITNYFVTKYQDYDIGCIGVMDTAINSANKGNEIIMQAVYENLHNIFKSDYVYRLPFFDDFGPKALKCISRCRYVFVGGTNALNSQMDIIRDIGVNQKNIDGMQNKIVLMGVGWRRYEDKPNLYTKELLYKMLNRDMMHSVRDSYTENMLKSIGIENVINTGCPTLWRVDKQHCDQIPIKKGEDAIVMFTPRRKEQDNFIMDVVQKNYNKIYFWTQTPGDYFYIKTKCERAIFIPPRLEDLEEFLQTHESIDYIGTRLHGGIKCIQYKKRAIIVAIDNRAIEMKKDFQLPVLLPEEVDHLEEEIYKKAAMDICIHQDKIKLWTSQFLI